MLFRFPKKKIVVDCFTSSEGIITASPVTLATKHLPNWWKKLPVSYIADGTFFPSPTMKNCVGMIDYYKNSIAIPLWSEMCIDVDQFSFQWQFSDKETEAGSHDVDNQARGFLSDHGHLKIISPWLFKTKEAISWVWSQPLYSFNKDNLNLKILPGILDFSKQRATNINLLIPLGQNKTYLLEHNQVMAHLTPMSDRKVEVVRHLISRDEYFTISTNGTPLSFTRKYRVVTSAINKFSDCPFKKGKEYGN